jgi:hypothetical protein
VACCTRTLEVDHPASPADYLNSPFHIFGHHVRRPFPTFASRYPLFHALKCSHHPPAPFVNLSAVRRLDATTHLPQMLGEGS